MNATNPHTDLLATGSPAPTDGPRPTACLSQIGAVRHRWSLLRRSTAISILAAWLACSMIIAVLLDAWIRGGHWWRAALLVLLVASVTWIIRRAVLPLWRGLSFNGAALLIEKTHPDLRGRLVTAVQLADASRRSGSGASHDLYERVRVSAEQQAGSVAAATAIPSGPVTKKCAAAWSLVLVVLAVAGLNHESATIGLSRILKPWQEINWPKRTHIRLIDTNDRVVRGGTLTLSGNVQGIIPANGLLRIRAGQGAADRAYFEVAADGQFNVQYRPVTQDLDVWVEIGDNATAPLHITMVPPPDIARIEAACTYPEYTHLPKQVVEDGNVQAVFGTQIALRIIANKAITEARLTWDDGKSVKMAVDSRPGATTDLAVEASRSYQINLTDENGFHNADPVIYRIEMTDNQYPQFDRVSPAIDRRVTPQAVLPINAEVSDDYGVANVSLCYRKGGDKEVGRVDVPLSATGKRVAVQYEWAMEPLGLKPGDTVTYWLEARDEGEHAARHDWPVSRARKLKLMSEVELARALSDELEQLMDKLSQLESLQAESAEAVKRIAGSVETARPAAIQERTRGEKWRQDRLARTTGQLGDQLGRIADDYAASRIGQQDRWLRLRATADRLGRLAGTDMPAIVLSLEDALNSLREGRTAATTQPKEESR